MVVKYSQDKDVCTELYKRLVRIFENKKRVYFSFSGGKESLIIANALFELITEKKIDPKLLNVLFIDEEAIYPCVEKIVHSWRKKFIMAGATFIWLCMEFRHYNCFNQLENDLSFICWDSSKRDVWIRQKPAFAVTSHPAFKQGDTYQDFGKRIKDGIHILGLRANESVQRRHNISAHKQQDNFLYPIYDWTLNDVWLYLYNKKVEIPDAYLYMWKISIPLQRLRISQFFSIDTAASLVRMMEFYPELYEKILKREPNAYLAMYYWDSEMFRRQTKKRKQLEQSNEIDYKKRFYEKFHNYPDKTKFEYEKIRKILLKYNGCNISNKVYEKMYLILESGDPKARTLRTIHVDINTIKAGGRR